MAQSNTPQNVSTSTTSGPAASAGPPSPRVSTLNATSHRRRSVDSPPVSMTTATTLFNMVGGIGAGSGGLGGHVSAAHDLDTFLPTFWARQVQTVEQEDPDVKHPPLPLARIKKVMKSDPDVKMISADAPLLFSKACEIFVMELTHRAFIIAETNKRRTLSRSDIARAAAGSDTFDFLIDILPAEEREGSGLPIKSPESRPASPVDSRAKGKGKAKKGSDAEPDLSGGGASSNAHLSSGVAFHQGGASTSLPRASFGIPTSSATAARGSTTQSSQQMPHSHPSSHSSNYSYPNPTAGRTMPGYTNSNQYAYMPLQQSLPRAATSTTGIQPAVHLSSQTSNTVPLAQGAVHTHPAAHAHHTHSGPHTPAHFGASSSHGTPDNAGVTLAFPDTQQHPRTDDDVAMQLSRHSSGAQAGTSSAPQTPHQSEISAALGLDGAKPSSANSATNLNALGLPGTLKASAAAAVGLPMSTSISVPQYVPAARKGDAVPAFVKKQRRQDRSEQSTPDQRSPIGQASPPPLSMSTLGGGRRTPPLQIVIPSAPGHHSPHPPMSMDKDETGSMHYQSQAMSGSNSGSSSVQLHQPSSSHYPPPLLNSEERGHQPPGSHNYQSQPDHHINRNASSTSSHPTSDAANGQYTHRENGGHAQFDNSMYNAQGAVQHNQPSYDTHGPTHVQASHGYPSSYTPHQANYSSGEASNHAYQQHAMQQPYQPPSQDVAHYTPQSDSRTAYQDPSTVQNFGHNYR